MLKFCSRGSHLIDTAEFPRQKGAYDGLHSWCKACVNRANRDRYLLTSAQHRARKRRYREENPVTVAASVMRSIAKNRMRVLISSARTRAKEYGWSFDLTDHREQMEARYALGRCEMTGLPFNTSGGRTWDSPSLDRIDPAKGYVYSNIRIILHGMNSALNNWGEDVLETMVVSWLARRDQREVA